MSVHADATTTEITDDQLDTVSAGRSIFDPIVEFGQLWGEIGRGILALPKEIGRGLHPKN